MKPVIGITMGDAAGIGPEIIVKAMMCDEIHQRCTPLIIGDAKIVRRAVTLLNSDLQVEILEDISNVSDDSGKIRCLDLDLLPADIAYGEVSGMAGDAAYRYVAKAIELAKNGEIDAICTAPLNKEALHKGGRLVPGHTEILALLTDTKDYSMMLSTPKLKVIHLTTHVGLLEAIALINPARTRTVIKLAHDLLQRAGNQRPRIGVCGINPHAGENGLFGNGEEESKLLPGILEAQREGIDVTGPHAADTLFYRAVRGEFDIVVACYHDQGHGPVKVLGIEAGVNITVGLNGGIIRTSVDHGTAFDIAGTGIADERSLLEAIRMAVELTPKR